MPPSFRVLCTLAALGLAATDVGAMFARFTESQLVERSDLIVVGTLIGRTTVRLEREDHELHVGVVAIDELVKGDPDESVALLVLPPPGPPLVSDQITYHIGQQGLWFLRLRAPGARGLYLADHPQRFAPMKDVGERIEAVRKLLAE